MEPLQPGEQVVVVNPEKLNLIAQRDSGASWFATIGIFAVINYLLIIGKVNVNFIFSLGITSLVTFVAREVDTGGIGQGIAFVFTLLGCAGAFFFARFAKKGYSWAFVAGMVLYALDGLLWVFFQDWIEVAAHGFALYCMFMGLRANLELQRKFPGNTDHAVTPIVGLTPSQETTEG
jgi:hypothetical protein